MALDALFTRFEWIAHRVGRGRRGLIRIEDIPDLRYWMEMLSDWPYAPNQTRSREVFIRFLKAAQSTATLRLIKRFGYFIESVEDSKQRWLKLILVDDHWFVPRGGDPFLHRR